LIHETCDLLNHYFYYNSWCKLKKKMWIIIITCEIVENNFEKKIETIVKDLSRTCNFCKS